MAANGEEKNQKDGSGKVARAAFFRIASVFPRVDGPLDHPSYLPSQELAPASFETGNL